MAPIPSPSGLPPVWIAISVIGAVVFLTTLPFLATAIWLYFKDVWYVMFKDRARYLETAKLRKEWNKAHYIEERRQHIVQIGIGRLILKNNLSEKQWMLLSELSQRSYFPARKYFPHPIIGALQNHIWDRVRYRFFGTGYYKDHFWIDMKEWTEAVARARGEIDIHLEEFAAAFPLAPPPYALVAGNPPQ